MEFIAGTCAGISQIVFGHPFDTTKILLQNNIKPSFHIPNLYRGWKFPFMSSILCNSSVFAIKEKTFSYTNNYWISGAVSGIYQGSILYIFDLYKIGKQIQRPLTLVDIYRNHGKYVSVGSEMIALSIYFGIYHTLREKEYNIMLSGGIAGMTNWGLIYPLDTLKNRQIGKNISFMEAYNMGSLYKGYSICITRAFLVNAINFFVYENVFMYLDDKE